MEKTPETKMATHRGSRRESDAEVDVVRPLGDTCPGLPVSGMRRGRWARTGVANTGRAREDAQPDAVVGGPAEKASMAVAGAEEWRGRRCRSLLLLGVEVMATLAAIMLDEARRRARIFQHKTE